MPSRRAVLGLLAGLAGCAEATDESTVTPSRQPTGTLAPTATGDRAASPTSPTNGEGTAAWRHPRHDPGQSGFAPDGYLPRDPGVAWSTTVRGDRTPPVVAGDSVFLAHAYGLYRFDRETGERHWLRELYGDEDVPTPTDRTGTRTSTPYHTDRTARVFRWPTLLDGRLAIGFGPWLLQFDAETGRIARADKRHGFGPLHPVVAGDTIYLVFADWVVAVDRAGGDNRWISGPGDVGAPGNDATLQRPVVVTGDSVVVADDASPAGLYGLEAATGTPRWEVTVGEPPVSLAGQGNTVVAAGHDGTITARNAGDGSERWTVEAAGVVERLVATDRRVYAGSARGPLGAFDRATGDRRFVDRGRPLAASPDGVLVTTGDELRARSRDGSRHWSHPEPAHDAVLLDGDVLVTTEDELVVLA